MQSQEECDFLYDTGFVFNEAACACFSLIQCRLQCPEGQILDPTKACECISLADYNLIFNHGLNDKCQIDGFDPSVYGNIETVNVFNFFGPIYGNIYGLGATDSSSSEDYSESDSTLEYESSTDSGYYSESDSTLEYESSTDTEYYSESESTLEYESSTEIEYSIESESTFIPSAYSMSSEADEADNHYAAAAPLIPVVDPVIEPIPAPAPSPGPKHFGRHRHRQRSQLGERCEGVDQRTGLLFLDCDEGLICARRPKLRGEVERESYCVEEAGAARNRNQRPLDQDVVETSDSSDESDLQDDRPPTRPGREVFYEGEDPYVKFNGKYKPTRREKPPNRKPRKDSNQDKSSQVVVFGGGKPK